MSQPPAKQKWQANIKPYNNERENGKKMLWTVFEMNKWQRCGPNKLLA